MIPCSRIQNYSFMKKHQRYVKKGATATALYNNADTATDRNGFRFYAQLGLQDIGGHALLVRCNSDTKLQQADS